MILVSLRIITPKSLQQSKGIHQMQDLMFQQDPRSLVILTLNRAMGNFLDALAKIEMKYRNINIIPHFFSKHNGHAIMNIMQVGRRFHKLIISDFLGRSDDKVLHKRWLPTNSKVRNLLLIAILLETNLHAVQRNNLDDSDRFIRSSQRLIHHRRWKVTILKSSYQPNVYGIFEWDHCLIILFCGNKTKPYLLLVNTKNY